MLPSSMIRARRALGARQTTHEAMSARKVFALIGALGGTEGMRLYLLLYPPRTWSFWIIVGWMPLVVSFCVAVQYFRDARTGSIAITKK
jgi:hypothetical protein